MNAENQTPDNIVPPTSRSPTVVPEPDPSTEPSPAPEETVSAEPASGPPRRIIPLLAAWGSAVLGRFTLQGAAVVIPLLALLITASQLRVAADQLRVAVQDSNDTQAVLGQIVGLQGSEVEVLRRIYGLQSEQALQGPSATANARQVTVLEATLEALAEERDRLFGMLLPTPTPSLPSQCPPLHLNITEVMVIPVAPFGVSSLGKYNEYVELYNYGSVQVDVGGWLLADRRGHPGTLVAWSDLFSDVPVGRAHTTTALIPPGGYALVLPASYVDGDMPYSTLVSPDTVVLALEGTDFIGDGLVAREASPLDVLVLYVGTPSRIDCVVSTYGTPALPLAGLNPLSIADDQLDAIPLAIPEGAGWGGFYRIHPEGPDRPSNWARFYWEEKTPGY